MKARTVLRRTRQGGFRVCLVRKGKEMQRSGRLPTKAALRLHLQINSILVVQGWNPALIALTQTRIKAMCND